MAKICAWRFLPVECGTVYSFTAPATRVVSKFSKQLHTDPMLVVVLAGRYMADGPEGPADREVRSGPGDVVYWPENVERVEWNSTDERLKVTGVYFRWTAVAPPLPTVLHDNHGVIRTLCTALLAVTDSPIPQRWAVRNAYLSAMIAEYICLAAQLREGLEAKVTRYIQEHLNDPIRLDDLTGHVGLERSHFCRKYKALTGRTPMDDVRRIKTEHAALTLSRRGWGLKTVATGLSMNDPLLLSKWLRKYVGIPVRDLRK